MGEHTHFKYVDDDLLEDYGIEQYKAREGLNCICIIGPHNETALFWKDIYVHYAVGACRETVLCRTKMFGEPCPVCAALFRGESTQRVTPAERERMKMRHRYLYFVLDWTTPHGTPWRLQWFDAPETVGEAILRLCCPPGRERFDISDPTGGKIVCFLRQGEGLNTVYRDFCAGDREPLPARWSKAELDFDPVLRIPDYDQLWRDLARYWGG